MIVIINYNTGNLGSVKNMIHKIGYDSIITSDPYIISKATKIFLPGVGSFDSGISQLQSLNIFEILNQKVLIEKVPILGICLGMQLMSKASEEGQMKGLGWIDGTTKRFDFSSLNNTYKIPHMGWNFISIKKQSNLSIDFKEKNKFYFVHSYYLSLNNNEDILFTSNHGIEFVCGFEKDNILGVQFHPEKSHKYGMKLIENFIKRY